MANKVNTGLVSLTFWNKEMDDAILEGCEESVKVLLKEIIKNSEEKQDVVFVEQEDLDDWRLCCKTVCSK